MVEEVSKEAPQHPSGFALLLEEFMQSCNGRLSLTDAIPLATRLWNRLDALSRLSYFPKHDYEKNVYQSMVRSIKGEERLNEEVDLIISQLKQNNTIVTHKFYFIDTLCHGKTYQMRYFVPTEIALAEFSIKDGITKTYNKIIRSADWADMETNIESLDELQTGDAYKEIVSFVGNEKRCSSLQFYAHEDSIKVIKSVLNLLREGFPQSQSEIKIYTIQRLLNSLKNAFQMSDDSQIPFNVEEDKCFEDDVNVSDGSLACLQHPGRYERELCSLSAVIRWGYVFAKHLCERCQIVLLPGSHYPYSNAAKENCDNEMNRERGRNLAFEDNKNNTVIASSPDIDIQDSQNGLEYNSDSTDYDEMVAKLSDLSVSINLEPNKSESSTSIPCIPSSTIEQWRDSQDKCNDPEDITNHVQKLSDADSTDSQVEDGQTYGGNGSFVLNYNDVCFSKGAEIETEDEGNDKSNDSIYGEVPISDEVAETGSIESDNVDSNTKNRGKFVSWFDSVTMNEDSDENEDKYLEKSYDSSDSELDDLVANLKEGKLNSNKLPCDFKSKCLFQNKTSSEKSFEERRQHYSYLKDVVPYSSFFDIPVGISFSTVTDPKPPSKSNVGFREKANKSNRN